MTHRDSLILDFADNRFPRYNIAMDENSLAKTKLHIGCGRSILDGYVHLDLVALPGVDVQADLNDRESTPLPFAADSFDEILGRHLIEHIRHPLAMMAELHRVAKNGATAILATPYGSSDDAFEDPTHVRQMFLNSWGYFSQPYFWRADYGYRGDWQTERIVLTLEMQGNEGRSPTEIMQDVKRFRNVVLEMTAFLRCVKPIREPKRELQQAPRIELNLI